MTALHAELAGGSIACKVCAYLETLPPTEAAEWRKELALPSPIISHMSVERALRRRSVFVSEAGVRRHRRNHP